MKVLTPAILLFAIMALSGCSEDKVKPHFSSTDSKEVPTQVSWDSEIYFSEEGNLKAVLISDTLEIFSDKNEVFLFGVHVDFYNQSRVKTSYLESKRGRVDQRTNNMYAIDSVVAINDSTGVKLTTDELMWRNNDQKIVSDKFVVITTPTERIEGYGFESDQSLQNYEIFKVTYIANSLNQNGNKK